MQFTDPKLLGIAFAGGVLPSMFWLWFWLKEEYNKPEPKGLLASVFFMGMLAVICVLPLQKLIQVIFHNANQQLILWAAAEELLKYLAVLLIVARTDFIDEPVDWPIYLITAALGFAALENTLFLLKPLSLGATAVSLLTGQLRYLGSTLLHTVSSGMLGIAVGVSIRQESLLRKWHLFVGFIVAITLHSVFNFFIIKNNGADFLKVFGFLWVVTVMMMLFFEKVRRME